MKNLALWQAMIPVLVPILLYLLKLGIKVLQDKAAWLLPILAPIAGGLLDASIAWSTGGTPNPVLGAILGSAGVGIREVVDQLKQPK